MDNFNLFAFIVVMIGALLILLTIVERKIFDVTSKIYLLVSMLGLIAIAIMLLQGSTDRVEF